MKGNKKSDKDYTDDCDPIDAYVGRRLREQRTLAGMSQVQLGHLIDVSFQQVQKYERGTNRIAAGRLYRLAHLLGVEVEWFYKGMPATCLTQKGQMPGNDNALDDEILNKRETLELLRAYYRVKDERKRRRFFELLKAMADEKPNSNA